MESNSGRSSATADSYIGSLISLTSKSEMRYEGVLYNINTDESSIGLRNVRSYGTEGRKKDGPQVPPSDKVYEYILFRGSDIKDLQVKSSPPAQTLPQPINNDPAIIQSHYPRPTSTSAVGGPPTDLGPQNAQFSNFQGGMPMYQPPPPPPNANMGGPWGPSLSPPTAPAGPGGLPMPMYWQGGYNFPPSNGGLPQQSFPRPPSGLPMPPIQYPGFNPSLPIGTSSSSLPGSNLPEIPSSLLPSNLTGSLNLAPASSNLPGSFNLAPASSNLPGSFNLGQSNLPPAPSISLSSEVLPSKPSMPSLSTPPLSTNLPPFSSITVSTTDANPVIPPISNKPNPTFISTFPYPIMSQQMSSIVGGSNLGPVDTPTPTLVTPGQLLNSTPAGVSTPQTANDKDVEEVVEVSSKTVEPLEKVERVESVAAESQPPLLPLPQSSRGAPNKPNGAPYQGRPAYRGRERGRGAGFSRSVAKFTEDFDFTAMNEKFNKDEVWGHLGKSNRSHKEGDESSDEDDYEVEDYSEAAKVEVKPVYNKDDFFDSISSNALDRESNNGRIRFSEQRKIDTETFGDFSRYHGSRGGHWNGRGGRYRGSYRGRGGYGGGGYAARGGGYAVRGGGGGGYAVRGGGYAVRGGGGRAMSNRD